MKTRGLADLHTLTDDELKRIISSAALDIYEAGVVFGEYEFDFALGTFAKLTEERARRVGEQRPAQRVGFLA